MTVALDSFQPSTVDELASFLREVAADGKTVRAHGGDTRERFGNLAPAPDHLIDMRGLANVIDYSPVDLTLAVEPGITLGAIDALLAERRQRLVLDAPHRERSTIGGTFAAGLSGPRRLRFGALKDFVVGAEVVTSEGSVASSGGMVVKNVSGYEMARLHYGAHGSFGIVTRLNLRVQPLPEQRLELRATYRDAGTCFEAAAALLTSNLDPAALYAVGNGEGRWTLHVQLEGSRVFVRAQADKVRQAILKANAAAETSATELDGPSTPAFDQAVDLTGPAERLVARLSVPASQQAEVVARLAGLEECSLLADAGSGLIYARCRADEQALRAVQAATRNVTYLALPDELKAGLDVFGPMDPGAASVLRRVKQQFDPQGIFSPGRFALHL